MGKMKISHCMKLPPEGTIGEGLPENSSTLSVQVCIFKVLWAIVMLSQPALRTAALYNGEPSEAFEQDRNMIKSIVYKT